jgi:Flp pilus assembly protein TadD
MGKNIFSLRIVSRAAIAAMLAAPTLIAAQQAVPAAIPVTSSPPAQAPTAMADAKTRLNNALMRLTQDSRDSSALLDAGRATLELGDARGAMGFLARADMLSPRNAAVRAAMAAAWVHMEDPYEGLKLFDEALALGANELTILADRGLAYDLIGNPRRAQKDYELALARNYSDETLRRYALSLGISGELDRAQRVLLPLLQREDRPAWRARVMILAMNGKIKDARDIMQQTMPSQLAAAVDPYLAQMDRLDAAQAAAAVHFGHFPDSDVALGVSRRKPVQLASASTGKASKPAPAAIDPDAKPKKKGKKDRDADRAASSGKGPVGISSGVILAKGGLPAPSSAKPDRASGSSPELAGLRPPAPPAPKPVAPAAPVTIIAENDAPESAVTSGRGGKILPAPAASAPPAQTGMATAAPPIMVPAQPAAPATATTKPVPPAATAKLEPAYVPIPPRAPKPAPEPAYVPIPPRDTKLATPTPAAPASTPTPTPAPAAPAPSIPAPIPAPSSAPASVTAPAMPRPTIFPATASTGPVSAPSPVEPAAAAAPASAPMPSNPVAMPSAAPTSVSPAVSSALPASDTAALPASSLPSTPTISGSVPIAATPIAIDPAPQQATAAVPPAPTPSRSKVPDVQPGFESLPAMPQPQVPAPQPAAAGPASGPASYALPAPAPVIQPAAASMDAPAPQQPAAVTPPTAVPAIEAAPASAALPPPVTLPETPQPVAAETPQPIRTLDAIAGAIAVPDSELSRPSDAVDLATIEKIAAEKRAAEREAARVAAEKAKAIKLKEEKDAAALAAKEKAKSPARVWVQIATGSDARALNGDFRRLATKNPALFKGKKGGIAPWNKTRRLLVGPFPTLKDAKAWEADLRKAGTNGFVWTSDSGEEVGALPAK